MNYLIWTNLYLTLFYGFYWVFLRNETLFNLNRWYLLSSVAFSFILPAVDFQGILSSGSATTFVAELPVLQIDGIAAAPGYPLWVTFYFAGCIISVLWLFYRLVSIRTSFKRSTPGTAYSFFSSIQVDDSLTGHDKILAHEKIHAEQFHSLDILVFEAVRAILWFNPVVHLMIYAGKLNHEYIADRETTYSRDDRVDYAKLLLNQSFNLPINSPANHFFNQSFLKKRIAMLFKNQSKKSISGRLLLLTPVILIFVVLQSTRSTASVTTSSEDSNLSFQDTTFTKVDVAPTPEGGFPGFYKFVGNNFKYPEAAVKAGVNGKLIVQFVVEKDGSLTDFEVLRDLGHGTAEEAVRMLKTSPKWKPGMVAGKPVRVQFTLPIQLNPASPAPVEPKEGDASDQL